MPLSKYFKGSGEKVMSKLKSEYGDKKGESVFYAMANKDKSQQENAHTYNESRRASKKSRS